MKNRNFTSPLIFFLATSMVLASCQAPKPASLSNDQVVQVVEGTLKAVNAGDFQSFTQYFSDAMKNSSSEQQFTNLAGLLKRSSGNYVSCVDSKPDLSNNQGYAVYRLPCKYELESVLVTVTFKVDGNQIEGLFFDSTNLRKVGQ